MSDVYGEPDSQSFDSDDQELPLAEFDYLSIHAVVIEPEKRHPAYGKTYTEYRKYRSRSIDEDADKKNSKVGFYCHPVIGRLLPTLARRRSMSMYSYINDMLEEGMIYFHPPHRDLYTEINDITDDLQARMSNDAQSRAVAKLCNQTISFDVCSRKNKLFVPRIANWLSEDIKTVSVDLHMTVSDTAYLLLLTGILNADAPEMPLNAYQDRIIGNTLTMFDQELDAMRDLCKYIASTFDSLC
jgi:hypothetical protein